MKQWQRLVSSSGGTTERPTPFAGRFAAEHWDKYAPDSLEITETSVDSGTYPILTFSDAPEMEIVLLDRPDQPALGAGEPSTVTTAPAVANAVFDATGPCLRQMPFTPERVRAALLARR